MKKVLTLSIVLLFFLAVARSTFAQTATLTATVRVNPLEVEIIAPSEVPVGKWFEIRAKVSNLGTERISRAFATLNTSPEFNVRGSEKKNLGSLPSGKTKTVKWRVRVGSSGKYITTVEAKGNLAGEQISATDSKVINIFSSSTVSFFSSFFRLASRFL